MLRAAFRFFEEHPEFVRLVRWEALEGGPILREELAVLSYLSDAPLMTDLLGADPMSADALAARREHVIDALRTAVAP